MNAKEKHNIKVGTKRALFLMVGFFAVSLIVWLAPVDLTLAALCGGVGTGIGLGAGIIGEAVIDG